MFELHCWQRRLALSTSKRVASLGASRELIALGNGRAWVGCITFVALFTVD